MAEKENDLLDRTFNFGVNCLKFLKSLHDEYIYRIPKVQLAKACTSVGANYEESQGAVSKRDFTHKIGISYKEARESVYWLRVLKELYEEEKYQKKFEDFIKEGIELRKILSAIKKKSSNNP